MIESWNFQGLFLLQKGSFQSNFSKIWDGHHGNLENIGSFDLEWPNYNLSISLLASNSSPILTWHNIFPYLVTSLSMLDNYGMDSPTHLILISFFIYFRPEGHCDSSSKDGFLSETDCLVSFERETLFLISLQYLSPRGHTLFIQLNCQSSLRNMLYVSYTSKKCMHPTSNIK